MAALRSLTAFGLLGAAFGAEPVEAPLPPLSAQLGEDVHCVGSRAHVLTWKVLGPVGRNLSYKDVQEASITLTPSPSKDVWCSLPPGGDSRVCFGANEDSTCSEAKQDLPLDWGLECKNCFLGATADVFYSMNYSALLLDHIEVGLRDIHLRSAAEASMEKKGSEEPLHGEFPVGNKTFTIIDKEVGCPVCLRVTITVNIPTVLKYDLRFKGDVDVTAGAAFDAGLGGQAVRWDHASGWKHIKNETAFSVSPIFDLATQGEGDLDLGFTSSLLLDVADIMWYRMDLSPSSAVRITEHGGEGKPTEAQVCLDGDASFTLSHEADLHWQFMTLKEFKHWGPTDDFHWSKQNAMHECKSREVRADSVVVV